MLYLYNIIYIILQLLFFTVLSVFWKLLWSLQFKMSSTPFAKFQLIFQLDTLTGDIIRKEHLEEVRFIIITCSMVTNVVLPRVELGQESLEKINAATKR